MYLSSEEVINKVTIFFSLLPPSSCYLFPHKLSVVSEDTMEEFFKIPFAERTKIVLSQNIQ
jgi:hypothetical protein